MRFKVKLERVLNPIGGKAINPFLVNLCLIDMGDTVSVSVREWEMEAKDESEVRKFYEDACKRDLPNVRGYNLRSIERIDAAMQSGK